MTTVSVHEAKTHLSRLLQRVAAGEEVEITNRGLVVARLVSPRRRPQMGLDEGRFDIPPEFDDPLPDDIARAFGA